MIMNSFLPFKNKLASSDMSNTGNKIVISSLPDKHNKKWVSDEYKPKTPLLDKAFEMTDKKKQRKRFRFTISGV